MSMRRLSPLALWVGCTALIAGCHCCDKKPCCSNPPPPPPPPRGAVLVPAPPTMTAPPAQPIYPGPAPVQPAVPGQPPPPSFPTSPPAAPGSMRYYGPAASNDWQPLEKSDVRLAPRESVVSPSSPSPGGNEERPLTPTLPVGIPQFAQVQQRVASGLTPNAEGLDWLKANGYRAVLHLRAPEADDSADRRDVEKRGMLYMSLALSAPTLTRPMADDFSRVLADPTHQPLFIYDRDGVLAGSMWYLHFRLTDRLPDEEARARAARLGLKDDAGPSKDMWLAIQKILSEQR